jgi:toxin ParE1/3/4
MTVRTVTLSRQADNDIRQARDFYALENGPSLARRFVLAIQAGLKRIGTHPQIGSLKYSNELSLPAVRCVFLTDFPHGVFYVEADDGIIVWRVLHTRRDIPVSLVSDE